jgi:hypothetical protein
MLMPCNLVDNDGRFRGVHCIHHHRGDGDDKDVLNVSQYLPEYTAQHTEKHPPSYSLPWNLKSQLFSDSLVY